MELTTISGLLRQVRGERQKQEMAEILGVTPSSYGRWERGESPFPFERLEWLAGEAGVDIADVQEAWRYDAGGRAMRRKQPDDADPMSLLVGLTNRLDDVAQLIGALVARVEALEGPKSRRRRSS